MKRNSLFAALTCLGVALILASCAPAAVTSGPAKNQAATAPAVTSPSAASPKGSPAAQAPKYGGTGNFFGGTTPLSAFDDVKGWYILANTLKLTNEELWQGDWTKGPAGTNELNWASNSGRFDQETGDIAQSWDISKPGTISVKIRQGIHYALNPNSAASRLVNGRELTADDVAFSLKQNVTQPTSFFYQTAPFLRDVAITAPDKWTVVINAPPEHMWEAVFDLLEGSSIVPPEVVRKYGDMADWHNSVGTGPFMLTDYVTGSSWTMVRNPNYWMKDPMGPGKGDQLPYLASATFFIIPDTSTQETALRTGKLDQIAGVTWDAAAQIKKTSPELASAKSYGGSRGQPIAMRIDDPKLPFHDLRVRQALMMATDFKSLLNSFAGGDGYINTWPLQYSKAYADAYLPLNETPAAVQQLYTYDPQKAKALLSEAGYPNGFKTQVLTDNQPADIDYYSAIKAMWAKVGVDLTIDAREWGTYYGLAQKRAYKEMMTSTQAPMAQLYEIPWVSSVNPSNGSFVSDKHIDQERQQILKLAVTDTPKADAQFKSTTADILAQVYMIPKPEGPLYTFWWPWLKNYHGEGNLGYFNTGLWAKYVWLDSDLKKSMGH